MCFILSPVLSCPGHERRYFVEQVIRTWPPPLCALAGQKKIKGNQESVRSEMQVLQGLDHPNIVRPISPPPLHFVHVASALVSSSIS